MSLRILLADDSMTAQNMGKKILSDAGYDVTAVSNGAAALKKANELKPDLVVLDIYMPGYTGLEVCERLKNAPDTSHIPVMLTVGKLEPYRAEDGARVRAEGVIIKPFEATDLLAAVQNLASAISAKPPAPVVAAPEPTATPAAPFIVSPVPASVTAPTVAATETAAMPAMPALDLPDPLDIPFVSASVPAMAAAMPAFGIAPKATESEPASGDSFQIEVADLPPMSAQSEAGSAINLDFLRTPVEAPVTPIPVPASEVEAPHEFEPTSAPQVSMLEVETEDALEPTLAPDSPVELSVDPALVTDPADIADFAVKVRAEVDVPAIAPEQSLEPEESTEQSVPTIEFANTISDSGHELDPIELFHEEYAPAADGSIDLSVPERQRATPPPIPVYENAGVAGYAVTPAMRDYLDRIAPKAEAEPVQATPEVVADHLPEPPIPVEEPEAIPEERHEVALENLPPIEIQAPEATDSPLDIDALLSEIGGTPEALAAESSAEVATLPPVTEPEADLLEEIVIPPHVEEEPVPPAPPEVVETEPASSVAEVSTEEAVSIEEPVIPEPSTVEPEPLIENAVSVVAADVTNEIEAANITEPVSGPETPVVAEVVEPEPSVNSVLAAVPEAEPETAEPSEGLSAIDRARIAGAVQRVFDRYKPQIIAEITRELMKQDE